MNLKRLQSLQKLQMFCRRIGNILNNTWDLEASYSDTIYDGFFESRLKNNNNKGNACTYTMRCLVRFHSVLKHKAAATQKQSVSLGEEEEQGALVCVGFNI